MGTGHSANRGVTKQAQVAEARSLIFANHFIVKLHHRPYKAVAATVISIVQVRKTKKHCKRWDLDPQRGDLWLVRLFRHYPRFIISECTGRMTSQSDSASCPGYSASPPPAAPHHSHPPRSQSGVEVTSRAKATSKATGQMLDCFRWGGGESKSGKEFPKKKFPRPFPQEGIFHSA